MLGLAPGSAWAGGNFPPVAVASADPQEALVGETIVFSSAGSLDPDDGPEPLSFDWDFGDGATSDEATPSHSYDEMGVFTVTLTVSDGLAQSLTSIAVVTLGPPTEVPPSASGPLALSPDGSTLAVANGDSGSVSLVATADLEVTEIEVGADPRGVAFTNDGARLLVTCRDEGELWVLDPSDGATLDTLPLGHAPFAVAVAPQTDRVVVTSEGDGLVFVLDDALAVEHEVPVGPEPRAIAIDSTGTTAWVAQFLTRGEVGEVVAIDLASGDASPPIALAEDPGPDSASSGRGWVSMNNPETPAPTAARASTGMNSRWPPELPPCPPGSCTLWVQSKTTGAKARIAARPRMSDTRLL